MEADIAFAQDEERRGSLLESKGPRWRSVGTPCAECDALVDAVDVLPLGVILIDGTGRVVFNNRSAAAILASGQGIGHTCDGRLTASRSADTRALKALIDRALNSPVGEDVEPSGAIQLWRSSTTRPLPVVVSPLRYRPDPPSPGWPAAIVLCGDPDRGPRRPRDMLARLYGLTPCEAALTLELLCGRTLKSAAGRLSISMNTARTHLKRVFHKTGTNRQSDLLRLVFRSPVALYL